MGDVTRRLFTKGNSGENAKERLRLILTLDRANLSPRLVEMLRVDVKRVVTRYLVIDEGHLEVGLENIRDEIALVITIPIVMVRRDVFSA